MKKRATCFLAGIMILIWTGMAWGDKAPVVVKQKLTSYSKSEKVVTLEYSVQVQNTEETALSNLTLSLVHRPPFVTTNTKLSIPTLAPKEKAEMTVKVVTPLLGEEKYFSKKPLQWAGRCTDAKGNLIEFPVKSRSGGAK